MKSQFLLLFVSIFASVFVIYSFHVDVTTSYEQQTTLYQEKLRETVAAAAKEASRNGYEEDETLYYFKREDQRNKTINAFYHTLQNTFNTVENTNSSYALKDKVPAIALIDTDGFYICYRQPLTISGSLEMRDVVTPIFTWSEATSERNYLIRYFVKEDELVEVTDLSNKRIITGTHKEVFDYFERDSELKEYLETKEDFQYHRISTIVLKTQETIEYYINNYNYLIKDISDEQDWGIRYTFEMPQIDYEDWCGLLDEPGVISFLQKRPFFSAGDYINVYAMKGVELIEKQFYVINEVDGEKLYHKISCPDADVNSDEFYNYKPDCAKAGAFPCDICKP